MKPERRKTCCNLETDSRWIYFVYKLCWMDICGWFYNFNLDNQMLENKNKQICHRTCFILDKTMMNGKKSRGINGRYERI